MKRKKKKTIIRPDMCYEPFHRFFDGFLMSITFVTVSRPHFTMKGQCELFLFPFIYICIY